MARTLAPADSLNFLCSVGIASAKFQAAQYEDSIRWYKRAIAENPAVTWTNRFLAPAYMLAGRTEEARRSFAAFTAEFPDLTIVDVRSGLPWNSIYLDGVAEGLESLGCGRARVVSPRGAGSISSPRALSVLIESEPKL